jgi:hypothetical protein
MRTEILTQFLTFYNEIWIYEFYHETNCQAAIQIFPDYTLHVKINASRSAGKMMLTSFFSTSVDTTATTLEAQHTETTQWYTIICLS